MEHVKAVMVLFVVLAVFDLSSARAWEVDLSRRRQNVFQTDGRGMASTKPTDVDSFDGVLSKVAGNVERQEFVILNTPSGFVPNSVRVKRGNHYLVHVVNVNEDKKNVSFMLDAFAQNHATYYGKIKTFNLDPNKDGVFVFNCPETSAEGRLIVFSGSNSGASIRTPASEGR